MECPFGRGVLRASPYCACLRAFAGLLGGLFFGDCPIWAKCVMSTFGTAENAVKLVSSIPEYPCGAFMGDGVSSPPSSSIDPLLASSSIDISPRTPSFSQSASSVSGVPGCSRTALVGDCWCWGLRLWTGDGEEESTAMDGLGHTMIESSDGRFSISSSNVE